MKASRLLQLLFGIAGVSFLILINILIDIFNDNSFC